jgi:hypothetical protein
MALLAGPPGEGGVDLFLEELRVLRRMGVMAASAVDRRRIDIQVRLGKRPTLDIMALPTQGLHRLEKE